MIRSIECKLECRIFQFNGITVFVPGKVFVQTFLIPVNHILAFGGPTRLAIWHEQPHTYEV